MAVRKLRSGKWVADVTVGVKWDGSRDRRVETYPTKGQARKAETRLLMEKERLRGRVTARITLAEFVDEVYWPRRRGCARTRGRATSATSGGASCPRSATWSSSR